MAITREDIRWLARIAAGEGEAFIEWYDNATRKEVGNFGSRGDLYHVWDYIGDGHSVELNEEGWKILKEYGECVAQEKQS